MRALAIVILGLIVAAASASAAPISVASILKNPTAYIGKKLTVSGIIGGVDIGLAYGQLCPHKAERAQLPAPTLEHPVCIDLAVHDDLRSDLKIKTEKYRGAIVGITGTYWHRCLPAVREREPEVAREECKDVGLNGWLGVESIAIRGYSADANITGLYLEDDRDEMTELAAQSEDRPAIDALVQNFLTAVRAKDANALALLAAKEVRGYARIGFTAPTTRLYWLILSPEMAVTNESARRPGTGYRVYGGDRNVQLCLCRRSDCTGVWPRHVSDGYSLNVASPVVCFAMQKVRRSWWMRY